MNNREQAIEAAIAKCKVPDWMRLDRHEPVTQEQFTRGLRGSARSLALSLGEIEDIAAGRIAKGQLRSYIPHA